MKRPIIGIPTQTLPAQPGAELPNCWIMGQSYVNSLRRVGAVPWLIPLFPDDHQTTQAIFDQLDGLFLTGGVDVDPSFYHESKTPHCGRTDLARDQVELQLLELCIQVKKPVLAVCRGIQILNVYHGGTLYQDIAQEVPAAMKHDYFPTLEQPDRAYPAHEITIATESKLGQVLNDTVLTVNSMHHQAIKDLGANLKITSYAPDGIIESVESTDHDHFCIAVQWHPEELLESHPGMKRLFSEFVRVSAAVPSHSDRY